MSRKMSITAGSKSSRLARWDAEAGLRILFVAVVSCLALALWARMKLGLGGELGFDEGATGGFAIQPSLSDVTWLAHSDPNAPAYAYLMWFWVRLFGASNESLQCPSLIASICGPLLAWRCLRRSRPATALVWTTLLALWLPGVPLAGYARCYALLFLAAIAATAAHRRALDEASLGTATAWTASAALMTLIHYDAGFLALTQGLVLVARHRRRCLGLWPAALAFVPAFCWIAWHAPRLAAFARPDTAWYDPLKASDLPNIVQFLFGMPGISLLAAAGIGFVAARRPWTGARTASEVNPVDLCVGAAAIGGAVICVGLGFLKPTFTLRYLTPFAPGILALAASLLVVLCRARPGPLALSVGVLAIPLAAAALLSPTPDGRVFGTEAASAWLAEARPGRMVYFWDNPAAAVVDARQLDAMGGFFLRRAGLSTEIVPLYRDGRDDMNDAVLSAAGTDAAILWIYDTVVHGTTAISHRPHFELGGPKLECRDFGFANFGVLACRRPTDGISARAG